MVDWPLVLVSLPQFGAGLLVTLALLAASLLAGLVLTVPLAIAKVSGAAWLARPVGGFTFVIRGTPLLVQLFVLYHGLAQFEAVRDSAAWPLLRSAWFCAWLAFTINTTAYTTEILAGALRNISAGEVEAARAYGISGWRLYRRILLPSAWRRALPQYSNEVVGLMHATAIASTVNLVDVTRVARDVYANHLAALEAFAPAAVIYLLLTLCLAGGFRALERHFQPHLFRPTPVAGAH